MDKQIEQIFKKADKNNNGSLDRNEAKGLISQVCYVMKKNNKETLDPEIMVNQMFDKIDINKDGEVSLEELKLAFKKYRD